jgi:Flp pilus assembly protein TadD
LRQNKLDEAERHFHEVLRLQPRDTVAKGNLEIITRARRDALRGK